MKNIKTDLSVIQVPNVTKTRFIEKVVRGKEWISYGADNRYPDYLWGLYCDAPTLASIIDAKVCFTMGNGSNVSDKVVNAKGETFDEVLRKVVFDYHLFGGFAIQVIYNKVGEIIEWYWADFSKLRINAQGTKVFWCDNWAGWQNKAIEYDVYNPKMTNKTTQIFYYRGASCRSVYPIPCYQSAIDSIETEIEIQHFWLSSIKNGMAVSCHVSFNNGVPDEETRKRMEDKINAKFTGSDNANKLLISWNDSKETAMSVERLESDNFDKKFAQMAKDVQESIFVANRITSGTLLGRIPTNTGFTKNEYKESCELFLLTVIKPCQKEILQAIRKIYPDFSEISPFVIEDNE